MKYILIGIIFGVLHYSTGHTIPNKLGECNQQGPFCSGCKDVAMCVDTEYGLMKQIAYSCPPGQTCYNGACIPKNPFCDGSSRIPFQCHVPGVFPDPFDCQKYHYCVVVHQNETDLILEAFEHKCQDDQNGKWSYDVKTSICSERLPDGKCTKWPVPLCLKEGATMFLLENKRIYYVCTKQAGLFNPYLYPQLYACPHGMVFNPLSKKCGWFDYTTTSTTDWTTTTPYWTTTTPYWTTTTPWTTVIPDWTSTTTRRTTDQETSRTTKDYDYSTTSGYTSTYY